MLCARNCMKQQINNHSEADHTQENRATKLTAENQGRKIKSPLVNGKEWFTLPQIRPVPIWQEAGRPA